MAQPVWQTAAGSLGVVPEGVFYQQILLATDPDLGPVTYSVIAGALPPGIQCTENGQIVGVPTASVQGVPDPVNRDITSKFVVRANSLGRIADRTFTLTITGNDVPRFVTAAGSLGTYYDGDEVEIQIDYDDDDPGDVSVVSVAAGALPPGLTLSPSGLISGYIQPATPLEQPPGFDLTAADAEPYDFVVEFVSRNYQFTLEVSDGKSTDQRTFTIFVYARNELTGDTTMITADNSVITADQSTERAPFLTNAVPSNLGRIRSDNNFAYEFIGDDYDTEQISYAISVNEGFGLPPGLTLDPGTGWLYGTIPDQGTTEVEYSFNINVYQTAPVGDPVVCTATAAGTNRITCVSTAPFVDPTFWYSVYTDPLLIPIKFTGTTFGGLSTADNTLYWVRHVYSATEFDITSSATSTTATTLTTGSGSMNANTVVASRAYPFSLTIVGDIDSEITWLTPSDLGTIVNGSTSTLRVEAVNRGGRALEYKLESGAFNSLPQGLQLLPSGDIAGRVTFNTFAIDLGATTFDSGSTNWDNEFVFTVNAYAPDTQQQLFSVAEINVTNGGTGYTSGNPPVLVFSTPIGASAVQAQVGNVTISGGAITAVELTNGGAGYTGTATLTEVSGPGSGATFDIVMEPAGTRDVVSVFKQFTLRVTREYNAPYQNLYVVAMPPEEDRVLIDTLLDNDTIFVPDYIYRPEDPNFGKATQVVYQHAIGLAPAALDLYTESLYLNHYWKNLTLGQIETAVARDAEDNIIYEVVYSKVIDNLVNPQGQSVSKLVPLPYAIIDPTDGSTVINVVYPNSLDNMRDQVIDTVGRISTGLPLWMTSKQDDGRVLGFTPAWVIAYTQPGRGRQIAYYLEQNFGEQLNKVDFKVDRYVLDRALSLNWDTTTQDWTPQPSLTTFDRLNTSEYDFIGNVSIATTLAFSDVNNRTLDYINSLGGLDGVISQVDGNTIVFVKQEDYDGPPGSNYPTTDAAWQRATTVYDGADYDPLFIDNGSGGRDPATSAFNGDPGSFDSAETVPGGYQITCTATTAGTNRITCDTTANLAVGDIIWFTGTGFGGISSFSPNNTYYYVLSIVNATQFTIASSPISVTPVTLTTAAGSLVGDFGNDRLSIWTLSVAPASGLVTCTQTRQTAPNDFVQIRRGNQFRTAFLYRSPTPGPDLTRNSWLPLPTIVTTETTFDQGSVEFIEPVDMYNPGETNDKYLVFPKANILE